ncbi:MAG: flagellar biosynthesis anti-sigma factor FlgM [Planctomycetota bacterium]
MEIRPDLQGFERLGRKRPPEKVAASAPLVSGRDGAGGDSVSTGDSAAIARFVETLKQVDPARLHRVEDLRARLAAGEYSATAEELADPILDALLAEPPQRS